MYIYSYYRKYQDDPAMPFKSQAGFYAWAHREKLFETNAVGRNLVDEVGLCEKLGIAFKEAGR